MNQGFPGRDVEVDQTPEYAAELEFALGIARNAGEVMRTNFGADNHTEWKADNTPVTQVDKSLNQLVIQQISERFPEDGVLGEEQSYEVDRSRVWVVDPIDGTQAFDIGVPVSTFCLALVEQGQAKLGVAYDPFLDRMYSAISGQGAFLNGEPIQVSEATSIDKNCVILSSRTKEAYKTTGEQYDAIVDAGGKSFSFRSVVYGFMRVATGHAVAAIAGSLGPWDYAAAKVILEESGATITDFTGQACEYDEVSNGIIVSNGRVHQTLLDIVRK